MQGDRTDDSTTDTAGLLLTFNKLLQETDALQHLNPQERKVTQLYFSEQNTLRDLMPLAGLTSPSGVHGMLKRSLTTIFDYLPPEAREAFETPDNVLRLRGKHQSEDVKEQRKKALIDEATGTFKPDHLKHLSEAATQRWQNERRAQGKPSSPSRLSLPSKIRENPQINYADDSTTNTAGLLLTFNKLLQETDALQHLNPQEREIIQLYFSEPVNLKDLMPLAGLTSRQGVRHMLERSLTTIFDYLPPDARETYKSPKEVLHLRGKHQSEAAKQNIKAALIDETTGTFKEEHRKHISEAASQRWQREREEHHNS